MRAVAEFQLPSRRSLDQSSYHTMYMTRYVCTDSFVPHPSLNTVAFSDLKRLLACHQWMAAVCTDSKRLVAYNQLWSWWQYILGLQTRLGQ